MYNKPKMKMWEELIIEIANGLWYSHNIDRGDFNGKLFSTFD